MQVLLASRTGPPPPQTQKTTNKQKKKKQKQVLSLAGHILPNGLNIKTVQNVDTHKEQQVKSEFSGK